MTLALDFDSETDKPSKHLGGLLVCIRIPKSGSDSLSRMLQSVLTDRRQFYLPNTLDLDGKISRFQRVRFLRAQVRNLMRHHRSSSLRRAFEIVTEQASDGDLVYGGHFDYPAIASAIPRKLKMIVLFREPAQRCLSEYNYSRQVYRMRNPLRYATAALLPKIAGRHDFDGYLDFLLEHKSVYGDVSCQFIGWEGQQSLDSYFAQNVFHAGILEDEESFTRKLSAKLGQRFAFPIENQTRERSAQAITASQRSKIEKIYARDFELYEWARKNL